MGDRLRSSALVQNGSLSFFLATAGANVAFFFFHVLMSRMLGPATYGALGSILGLTTVVTLAVTAFQAAVVQAVAERRDEPLRVARSLRRTAAVGAGIFALVAALSPLLRGFLHFSSVVPVLLFGCFVAAQVTSLVPQGLHIGRLHFGRVALAVAVGAALRLATGPLFVKLGWGLDGAVAATVVNSVCSLSILLWPLRAELVAASGVAEFRFRPRSAALAVIALGGVSAFVGTDSFLARHFLGRTASGYYVAAATAARIALFLPAAVGMMAFPRLAAHGGRGPEARTVLLHAMAAVTALAVTAAVVIVAFPHLVIDVLFGKQYASAATALRLLSVGAAAIGFVTVSVYALLARRSALCAVAWPALAAMATGVALAHGSVNTVASVVLVVSLGLLAAVFLSLAGPTLLRRPAAAPGAVLARLHTGRRPAAGVTTGTESP